MSVATQIRVLKPTLSLMVFRDGSLGWPSGDDVTDGTQHAGPGKRVPARPFHQAHWTAWEDGHCGLSRPSAHTATAGTVPWDFAYVCPPVFGGRNSCCL